jgi:nitroreductase
METLAAMHARKSIREYTNATVPAETIRRMVEAAGRAPSSKNTQPWKLFLVQGTALDKLRSDYLDAFDQSAPMAYEYGYSPDPLPADYKNRAVTLGKAIFAHKGIGREDTMKRKLHDRENFAFFGAPQAFFLAVPKDGFNYGTFMDCGLFFQSLMLAITAEGLGSCPQFSVMAYPELLRKHMPGSEGMLFIAALPFGEPLPGSHVNAFDTPREPVDNFLTVIG